ncbi:hypothetical protein [Francisella philomiragia]|uniref:Response regulator n=1 Tax=Francisella philomiragia TaxID=28110 RepID=A0A0B6D4L5_9GAMM|nr:hypothetical protein [Francisella philomiragia]AJI52603.1 hypothetical protein LA55_1949 [Francisella philomiragia]
MINIVYVDDQSSEISTFKWSFLRQVDDKYEVNILGIEPKYSLEDTYVEIFDSNKVDAVIVDFFLTDMASTNFNGAELINYILHRNPLMPAFLLTAFQSDAIKSESIDVYHVYPKAILSKRQTNGEHESTFSDLVKKQINKSESKLKEAVRELEKLIEDKQIDNDWTIDKEDRLIELDNLLEKYGFSNSIPSLLKRDSNIDKLVELIQVTRNLLDEISDEKANT